MEQVTKNLKNVSLSFGEEKPTGEEHCTLAGMIGEHLLTFVLSFVSKNVFMRNFVLNHILGKVNQ